MGIHPNVNSIKLKRVVKPVNRIGDNASSKTPIMAVTANGEVQTNDEATVYVKELNLLVTLNFLEDTPAVLLEKLCEEHGNSQGVDQWSTTTTYLNAMQHGKLRTDRCPTERSLQKFFQLSHTCISNIIIA